MSQRGGSFDYAAAMGAGALVFEPLHDITLYAAHNEIHFYTWGEERCILPVGGTSATLEVDESDGGLENLREGDLLLLEEMRSPSGQGEADPAHRHVVRLTEVIFREDPITEDGPEGQPTPVVEVRWAPEDALPFPLHIGTVGQEQISVARGNIVLADHGCTMTRQPLQPRTVPVGENYRPRLPVRDLTYCVPYDHNQARQRPAIGVFSQDPREALPDIKLEGQGAEWEPRRDLLGSDRFATEFVVEVDESGRGQLRFGDNILGKRPATGTTFEAQYRIGGGRSGNIGSEALNRIILETEDIREDSITVRNPLPARGGIDPEPLEHVRLYASSTFRTPERAVTASDYAEIAQRYPEVQKAVARLRWTGSWGTVFILVDRREGRPVDTPFKDELRQFLECFRLTGHDMEIRAPQFVPLDIVLTVLVAPGYSRSEIRKALLEVLGGEDGPSGIRGLFHPDNYTFGQSIYLSQVVAAAMQLTGVERVDPLRFQRWGKPARGELEQACIQVGPLEIARLDNNPNAPERGRIEFEMSGGI